MGAANNCSDFLDVYIGCVSSAHNVAAEGKYIAICSTTVETGMASLSSAAHVCPANPQAELQVAFEAIGPVLERFIAVDDLLEPVADGKATGIFITKVRELAPTYLTT